MLCTYIEPRVFRRNSCFGPHVSTSALLSVSFLSGFCISGYQMLRRWIVSIAQVLLGLVYLANSSLADTLRRDSSNGCGELAGSCNERVCCCSSNGFLAQTPNSEGECEWNLSGGYQGPVFLIVVSVFPALLSLCLIRFGRSLQLKHSSIHAKSFK